jgi:diketogulonate reductase-like aldo/keto reductase
MPDGGKAIRKLRSNQYQQSRLGVSVQLIEGFYASAFCGARAPAWQNSAMAIKQAARVPDFLYGTAWKEDRSAGLTELAIRMGFRAIDTANQRRHYFEEGVGQGLAAAYLAGGVARGDLFLQTKFTYQRGQDDRLPYDPTARLSVQVAQSMASSLEHLGTDHVDSYVLHGPSSGYDWTDDDAEAWEAMRKERDGGRTRLLGVSNVSLRHLEQMAAARTEAPAFVQNRCFARVGWDRDVRAFCRQQKIVYQGFSLLTANTDVLRHPLITGLAASANATPAQVVFAFARAVGMLPMTGTSDAEHMKQDLAARDLILSPDAVQAMESLAG